MVKGRALSRKEWKQKVSGPQGGNLKSKYDY